MKLLKSFVITAALSCCSLMGGNLILNSDFSRLNQKNFPAYWSVISQGDAQAAKIAGADGKELPVLEFDLRKNARPTRIEQVLELKVNRTYKVSFMAKTENLSGAGVFLTTLRWSGGASQHLKGTSPWKKYEFTAKFTGTDTRYRLILFAPKGASGKLWFRNVQVEEVIAAGDMPESFITIPFTDTPPKIDGRLDDPIYSQIPAYTPFTEIGKTAYSRFAQDDTELYLACDRKNLYAAFRCYQECLNPERNMLDQFRNNIRKRDGAVVQDDCVRLFIGADSPESPIYEFTVNSLGTLKDAQCSGKDIWQGRDLTFNSSAATAGSVNNGFYVVEMSIPLADLQLAPEAGQSILLMAGRINISRQNATVYFPRAEAFHLRSILGKARFGQAPAIRNYRLDTASGNRRKISFQANTSGTLTVNAVGENDLPQIKRFDFKSGNNTFEYDLPGLEYNSMTFSLSTPAGIFWQTPTYVIGNAMINSIIYSQGSRSNFNATQGIYPAPATPLKLQKSGYPGIFEVPATVKRLAVAQTLFWPENRNNFHIANGSLQPLHIVSSTAERQLANVDYQLNVFLPSDLSIESVTAAYSKTSPATLTSIKELNIQNRPYRHYTITGKNTLEYKLQPGNNDLITLLIRSHGVYSKRDNQRIAYVYGVYDNGRIAEVPQVLTVNIYPPLAGKTPQLFQSEMWGGSMVNLADREGNLRFLTDTVQKAGFNRLQNFPVPGMKRFGVLAYSRILNPFMRKLLPQHPEYRRITSSGAAAGLDQQNFICTDILINSPEVAAIGQRELARQLKDYDLIYLDYENPAQDGALSCYCDRCLQKFADFAGLPQVPGRSDIHRLHNDKWCDFMTGRIAEICSMWKKIVNKLNKKFCFYSGYQSPKSLRQYSVDWRKLAGKIDYAGAGYTRTAAEISATTTALKTTPLLSGVIAEPWHVNHRQESLQITQAYLAAGLISGSKGFLVYNLPGCDGRSFHNFSEVNRFLSDHEDSLYHASRTRNGVRVQGIGGANYMLFTQPGKPSILICYSTEKKRRQIYVSLPFERCREYFTGRKFSGKKFTAMINPGEMAAFIEEK